MARVKVSKDELETIKALAGDLPYAPYSLKNWHQWLADRTYSLARAGEKTDLLLVRISRVSGGISHVPMGGFDVLPGNYLENLAVRRDPLDIHPTYRYLDADGAPNGCAADRKALYAGVDFPAGTLVTRLTALGFRNHERHQRWLARGANSAAPTTATVALPTVALDLAPLLDAISAGANLATSVPATEPPTVIEPAAAPPETAKERKARKAREKRAASKGA